MSVHPAVGATSAVRRLLLVMPHQQLVRKAAEAGFRVWSLWDPRLPEADRLPKVGEASEELLLADFADEPGLRDLVARVCRRCGIQTVLHCGSGTSVQPVMDVAWRLGLSANPPAAFALLGASGSEAPAEAPRLSVQTLTVDGSHHVVGVSAQRSSGAPHFLVTGHLHPAPLRKKERATVERAVTGVLRTSGYRFGPAETEVALTADGPRVLACHPRPGSDRIPLLIEVASGFDCERALFEALLGRTPQVPATHQCAEIGFFLLPEGRLLTYTGTENIAVTPWVRGARFPYAVGDRTPPAGHPHARRGYVVVEGDSPEHTRERVCQARDDLVTLIRIGGEQP